MVLTEQRYVKVNYAVAVASLIFLYVITAIDFSPPLFDEIGFVRNLHLFEEYGLSKKFLLEMKDQAPGPLYQFIHTIFKPLTGYNTPGVRLVSVFLLTMIILCAWKILKLRNYDGDVMLIALNLMAVPVVWQISGLALTEIPAMFVGMLACLSMGVLVKQYNTNSIQGAAMALLTGVLMGLAVLGRTQFLMLLPAAAIFVLNPIADKGNRTTIPIYYLAIIYVTAITICAPVFLTWKALLPPQQAVIAQGGIKPLHGLLAFSYAGLCVVFINPKWFRFNKTILIWMLVLFVVSVVANIYVLKMAYLPLFGFLSQHMPTSFMAIYPFLISPVLVVFAIYFLYNAVLYAFENRNDSYYLFFTILTVLMLATCATITHLFSSRYVAQVAPFILIVAAQQEKPDGYKIARLCVGFILGYLSLQTYITNTYQPLS